MNLKKYEPLIIAFFVTMVRYYDYSIFGLSAALLSKNFMPSGSAADQMMKFFAVLSIATIAKPIGSLIFGRIGDKAGRVASVKISMVIAVISTSLVAFIPGFSSIGFLAVILITLLRMLFLISLAGEIDAIKIYVAEMVGKNRRHLVIGIVSFSSQIGVFVASVAYHLAVTYEDTPWLWRINFVIGGLLGLIAILLREKLLESKEFLDSKLKNTDKSNINIVKILSVNKIKFILATIINGMLGGGYHFLIIFFATFAANAVNLVDNEQASATNSMLALTYASACIISGYLADRFNKTDKQIIGALSLSITCVIMMEFMLEADNYSLFLHHALVALAPFYAIPCNIRIQSLFQAGIRMRMYSLSHSVGSMVFSSTTPLICMLIWESTKTVSLVLAYFLFQLGLLFFALLYMIKKDYNSMFETSR